MSFMIFDLKENKIGDVSYRGFTRYEGYNLFDFEPFSNIILFLYVDGIIKFSGSSTLLYPTI